MTANHGLSGKVMTVTGTVDPEQLGVTNPHEHLIIDFLAVPEEAQTSHQAAFDPESRARYEEPLTLANYYAARRNPFLFRDTLQLIDLDDAEEALRAFKAAGGGCIVDLTPIGVGRNPQGLREISIKSGVAVVMGTGYYVVDFHPPEIAGHGEATIYDRITSELADGVDGVRPGIIGEIGLVWPAHEREKTVLRAAARAQVDTGYCLTIHLGRNEGSPAEALAIVEGVGGDPTRTIMDHLDRTIFTTAEYLELAKTGCYLEMDLFGLESSFYPVGDIDMPNDAMRVDKIIALAEAGHLEQVLISLDIDTRTRLTKYGGEGYEHIIKHVVPVMRRKGLSEDDVDTVLKKNPQRALTIQ